MHYETRVLVSGAQSGAHFFRCERECERRSQFSVSVKVSGRSSILVKIFMILAKNSQKFRTF